MKKSLIILGLLVCTTGLAFADEAITSTQDTITETAQQVEVQNNKDRTKFQTENNKISNQDKKNFQKYNKKTNNEKFKNFDNKKADKNFKPYNQNIRRDRFNNNINRQNPTPRKYVGHRPHHTYSYGRPYYHHHNNYIRNSHKPTIHNYQKRSHQPRKISPKKV